VEKASGKPPEPAISQAGIGFLLDNTQPIEISLLGGSLGGRIEQQVYEVVCQRPSDEKFHGQVVYALGVFAFVSGFGANPALRKNIPDRAGNRLEALTRPGSIWCNNIVEEQMALIKRVIRAGEPDWTAAVLLQQIRSQLRVLRLLNNGTFSLVHDGVLPYLTSLSDAGYKSEAETRRDAALPVSF